MKKIYKCSFCLIRDQGWTIDFDFFKYSLSSSPDRELNLTLLDPLKRNLLIPLMTSSRSLGGCIPIDNSRLKFLMRVAKSLWSPICEWRNRSFKLMRKTNRLEDFLEESSRGFESVEHCHKERLHLLQPRVGRFDVVHRIGCCLVQGDQGSGQTRLK